MIGMSFEVYIYYIYIQYIHIYIYIHIESQRKKLQNGMLIIFSGSYVQMVAATT